MFRCLNCGSEHTAKEWVTRTRKEYTDVEKHDFNDDVLDFYNSRGIYYWFCPTCNKEIDGDNIQYFITMT
jgi:hypothetical protein